MTRIVCLFADGTGVQTSDIVGTRAERKYYAVLFTHGPLWTGKKVFFESKEAFARFNTHHRADVEAAGFFKVVKPAVTNAPRWGVQDEVNLATILV